MRSRFEEGGDSGSAGSGSLDRERFDVDANRGGGAMSPKQRYILSNPINNITQVVHADALGRFSKFYLKTLPRK